MRTLTKLTMVLGVATIVGSTAFAQTTPTDSKAKPQASEHKSHEHKSHNHKADREQKFAEASKRLNLSESQQVKLKEILAANKTEMKTWKDANKDATKEQKKTAMIAQFKKLDGQITGLLDTKQQAIYNDMKAEKKKEMQTKRAERMKEQEEMENYKGIF